MAADTYRASWQDTPDAAAVAALTETRVRDDEYVTCLYRSMRALVPIDPTAEWEFRIDVAYSATRDQYRATIARRPYLGVG